MKNVLTTFALIATTFFYAQNNSIIGKWKTIDDESGKAKSVVEIFEKSGKYYGKVVDILDPNIRTNLCVKCKGEDANKPLIGLTIIKGLVKDDDEYNSGTIMDPNNGKDYKCLIELDGSNKIVVRGYIGFSLLGRSQEWYRMQDFSL